MYIADIGHLISPNMKLSEYPDIIATVRSADVIVWNVANQWIRRILCKRFVPDDICDLMIRFWPQINARPLGLPHERVSEDMNSWNEQMQNGRNTIISYIKTV